MPLSEEENCAVRADGTLKDASEITWLNSPSDETPISEDRFLVDDQVPSEGTQEATPPPIPPQREKRQIKLTNKLQQQPTLERFIIAGNRTVITSSSKTNTAGSTSNTRSKSVSVQKQSTHTRTAPQAATSVSAGNKRPAPKDSEVEGDVQKRIRYSRTATTKTVVRNEHSSEDENPQVLSDDDEDLYEGSQDATTEVSEANSQDEASNAEYEKIKADSKIDTKPKRKHNPRGQDNRTQDIRACFEPGKRLVDGQERDGHLCLLCRKIGISEENSFFLGHNSTLRTHIRRSWSTHGEGYLNACKAGDIEPNPRAMRQADDGDDDGAGQTKIDGFVQRTPKWTREGLKEYIMNWLIATDQPFEGVDHPTFRALLKYQRQSTLESDIPHRTLVSEDVTYKADLIQYRIRQYFKTTSSEISLTFDLWTSRPYDAYLGITAHYIDVPGDRSNEWELKTVTLGYSVVEGNHSGANIAAHIIQVLDKFGLREKIGWCTADNASVNDKAIRCISKYKGVDTSARPWDPRQRRGRCVEHTIHLAAKAFIDALHPKWKKKPTRNAFRDTEDNESEDDEAKGDSNDRWVVDYVDAIHRPREKEPVVAPISGDQIELEPEEFEPGDTLGKLLALITQIRASPQAKAYFRVVCQEEGIKPLQLIKFIRTRWGSMHDLVERAIKNKAAINKFCVVADASGKVPKLKNKLYEDYRIASQEWLFLEMICEVLAEPRSAQAEFSSASNPTVSKVLPILECLRTNWEAFASTRKFAPVKDAIEAGLAKVGKWYKDIRKNDMVFVCLALDPSIKLEYCKSKWNDDDFEEGMRLLNNVFDRYAVR